MEKGKSLLYVADSRRGHATQHTRGSVYRDSFERDGWTVAFLDAAKARDGAIVAAARRHALVYLLKAGSFALVRKLRKRTDARLVFDLTDPLWKTAHRHAGWHDLDRILRTVDAVFCENEIVRAYASKFNRNVVVLPTCGQVELFDAARASLPPRRADDGRVVVGWVGSRTTAGALGKVREPLLRLCARHPGLELRIAGCRPADAARMLRGLPYTLLPEYGQEEMIREMLALDIGIFPAPLDPEDYRVRGPLKALLYMAAGLPAVCQEGGDCSAILQDGVNGMLAGTEEEWERKLEALIVSPDLRRSMGRAALERVRRDHSLARVHGLTRDALLRVLEGGEPIRAAGAGFRRPDPLPLRVRAGDWARSLGFRAGAVLARIRRALA